MFSNRQTQRILKTKIQVLFFSFFKTIVKFNFFSIPRKKLKKCRKWKIGNWKLIWFGKWKTEVEKKNTERCTNETKWLKFLKMKFLLRNQTTFMIVNFIVFACSKALNLKLSSLNLVSKYVLKCKWATIS